MDWLPDLPVLRESLLGAGFIAALCLTVYIYRTSRSDIMKCWQKLADITEGNAKRMEELHNSRLESDKETRMFLSQLGELVRDVGQKMNGK